MGAYQNNQQEPRDKKGKRGSVDNKKRLAAFSQGSATGKADWGGCSPEKLQAAVAGITLKGGAITFGLSRDQGAHSLTLLLDGEKVTLWFNGGADLDVELDGVMGTLEAMD